MQPKKKPCKGTGSAKGWGCGNLTFHRVYGLGKMCCYPDWLLNSEAGRLKLEKATLKASKPRRELETKRVEEKKIQSLESLKQGLKTVFHEYIRLRDKGRPCISSGRTWQPDFQAGHFFKAELYPRLKYDERNVNGQSVYDNCTKDGNFQGYSERLPGRIGQQEYDELRRLAEIDKRTPFKWDRQELIDLRKHYRKKINDLKNGAGVTNTDS